MHRADLDCFILLSFLPLYSCAFIKLGKNKINVIEKKIKPKILPPEILLNLGIRLRLNYERFKARDDL